MPVDSSHPAKYYIASFDYGSAARPTEHEMQLIRSYIEYVCLGGYYREGYGEQILARPEPLDGGHNTVIFHKRAEGDWGYRRMTWTQGPMFYPQPVTGHGEAMDLPAVLDKINDLIPERWERWKKDHPEVFGAPNGPSVHLPAYRRYVRGKQQWSNFNAYGWHVVCSCGWTHRHNGPKSEAASWFKDHAHDAIEDDAR